MGNFYLFKSHGYSSNERQSHVREYKEFPKAVFIELEENGFLGHTYFKLANLPDNFPLRSSFEFDARGNDREFSQFYYYSVPEETQGFADFIQHKQVRKPTRRFIQVNEPYDGAIRYEMNGKFKSIELKVFDGTRRVSIEFSNNQEDMMIGINDFSNPEELLNWIINGKKNIIVDEFIKNLEYRCDYERIKKSINLLNAVFAFSLEEINPGGYNDYDLLLMNNNLIQVTDVCEEPFTFISEYFISPTRAAEILKDKLDLYMESYFKGIV